MHKKPKIEPATTKSLTLLMDTRRKELEMRKKKKEDILREDEQRIKKQNDFNERVRKSAVVTEYRNKLRELNEKIENGKRDFKAHEKEEFKEYKKKLDEMKQKISNRPLMMEEVVRKKKVSSMEQENA